MCRMTISIDDLEFSVLKVVRDAEEPLWKKRIYIVLEERQDELPLTDADFSEQTIGRRIDNLLNTGLLETTVAQSEDLERRNIIAYQLTDDGEEVLKEKRRKYIRDIVRRDIFLDYMEHEEPVEPLLSVISDEFDLNEADEQLLRDRYNGVQLASFLALYYVHKETLDLFTSEERNAIRAVAAEEKTLSETIRSLSEE